MNFPKLGEMNSERFLAKAFNEERREKWIRGALLRRNVYLASFIAGVLCVPCAALGGHPALCVLSLFLATISLVVMTKYDTQLCFLRILQARDEQPETEDHSNFET